MNAIIRAAKKREAIEKLRQRMAYRRGMEKEIRDAIADLKEMTLRGDNSYKIQRQNEYIARLERALARKTPSVTRTERQHEQRA